MDTKFYLGITFLGTLIGISYGCSPEAWVTPTLESKAHYADIIAIGEVTRIDPKDPGNFVGNTYGAYVQVQCTYKGGLLGDVIEIGGVGEWLIPEKRYLI